MKMFLVIVWLASCLLTGVVSNKIGVSWWQLGLVEVLFFFNLVAAYLAFSSPVHKQRSAHGH